MRRNGSFITIKEGRRGMFICSIRLCRLCMWLDIEEFEPDVMKSV
jgi:hypothetical protein